MTLNRDLCIEPLRELEMLSPWFDASSPMQAKQAPITTARRLLVLLAPPRSGSFHLCRLLWQLGYGMPTEYLNPNPLYRAALGRWGRVGTRPWLATLVAERSARSVFSGTPFFSLKLQAHQSRGSCHRVLRRRFQAPQESLGLRREDPLVVLLRRRDRVAAIASLHFSRCTGAFDQGLSVTHQGLPICSLLDPCAIQQTIEQYYSHLRWLEEAAQRITPLHPIWMEDLMADQSAVLHKLVWALEPEVQLVENDSRLGVRIQPDRSIWADQRRDWLHQIAELVRELEGR
jgi:LPS sulfotransferase NodH